MGGFNFYAYVGNNPVNLIDPFGLCKNVSTEDRVAVAAAGCAITASGGLLWMIAGQLGIPEITGYLVIGGWGVIGVGVVTVVVGPFIVGGNSQTPNPPPQPLPSHSPINSPNNPNTFPLLPAH